MQFLPTVAFLTTLLGMMAWKPTWGFRRTILRSMSLVAAYALTTSELLGAGAQITRGSLAVIWLIPTFLVGIALIVMYLRGIRIRMPEVDLSQLSRFEIAIWVGLGIILIITAVVAWIAPPQTWDSLNYHMARVAHWAQAKSLDHFATGIEVQNSRTAAAEILVLHTYVLSQSDRWVNFVQWLAMLGSLVGSSLIASQLGAKRLGQLAAVVFAATLPMGIIQASSTMTDYVAALWVVAATSEVLELRGGQLHNSSPVFLALAAGLGIATKPTTITLLVPLGIYAGYLLFKAIGVGRTLAWGILAVAVIAVLNGGQLLRNVRTYESFLNSAQVAIHSNELRSPQGLVSNMLRHAGLHAGTPSPHVNKALTRGFQELHKWMNLDINDPRTTAHGVFKIEIPTTNEDRAGNPLHAYLLVGLLAGAIWKRPAGLRPLVHYGLILFAAALILAFLFKWQIFAARYHLMFFILASPAAGLLMEQLLSRLWISILLLVMMLAAIPWLFQINSRPLVSGTSEANVGSILTEARETLYLANGPHLLDPYFEITGRIQRAGCGQVGLLLSGNGAEYPLWEYLNAPRERLQFEWIVSGTPSAKYELPAFSPCAVICEGCPKDWTIIRSLPLNYEVGEFKLFLNPDPSSS